MAASLTKAINWLVDNEDLTDLIADDYDTEDGSSTVSLALVADLFDKTEQEIADKIKREIEKHGR